MINKPWDGFEDQQQQQRSFKEQLIKGAGMMGCKTRMMGENVALIGINLLVY